MRIPGGGGAALLLVVLLAGCDGQGNRPVASSTPSSSVGVSPTTAAPSPAGAPTWRSLADAPEARQEVAAAPVGGRIWVVGGITAAGASTSVESYDPAADRWQAGPDLPVGLHHSAAAEFRGELVVVGGFEASGGDLYAQPSDRVLVLRGGAWVELPRLHRPRGAAAAAVVGNTLFVVGGRDRSLLVRPGEAFDGTSWQDRAPIPVPRDHLGATSDGRYLYALGGRYLGADQTTGTAERYDPATDGWQPLTPVPTARGGQGVALAGGRVVVAGGEDSGRVYPQVEALDLATGQWASLPPMPTPRHGLALVTVAGTVYALVGGTAAGVAPSAAAESLAIA
jgi:non-specific serine/threonine protein kinase